MSRIGKNPIKVPKGVQVDIKDGLINVKGPLGSLSQNIPNAIKVTLKQEEIIVTRSSDERTDRALHGLARNLIANMVKGTTEGFKKVLVIQGVGYKAEVKGDILVLQLGFSHPVNFKIPKGVDIKMEGQTKMNLSSIDKQQLGEVTAEIRALKPPEPYKGKGIRYLDEYVKRKVGKTGVTTGATT